MPQSIHDRWFAIQVRPQCERMVSQLLRYKGYEDFLPLYTVSARVRGAKPRETPLFPGYVFCRVTTMAHGLIVTTPGVLRIVGAGSAPTPIDDKEIESLRAAVVSCLPLHPWPAWDQGDTVELTHGPLQGCRGILKGTKTERRLIVSISLLERAVAVEIESDWVQRAPEPNRHAPIPECPAPAV